MGMKEVERVAILDKDDASVFYEYAKKESTPEEKEELKKDLEFYKNHCPKK